MAPKARTFPGAPVIARSSCCSAVRAAPMSVGDEVIVQEFNLSGTAASANRINRTPFRCVRVVKRTSDAGNAVVLRLYDAPGMRVSGHSQERSLDPEMGSWQSTTDPIDTTWSSVLTYTSADGSKKLMIQFPSGDTIPLFRLVAKIHKNYDPDADLGETRKRKLPAPSPANTTRYDDLDDLRRRSRPYHPINTLRPSPKLPLAPSTPTHQVKHEFVRTPRSAPGVLTTRAGTLSSGNPLGTIVPRTPNGIRPVAMRTDENRSPVRRQALEFTPTKRLPLSPVRAPPSPKMEAPLGKGGLRNIGNSCYINACVSALQKLHVAVGEMMALAPASRSISERNENEFSDGEGAVSNGHSVAPVSIFQRFADVVRHMRSTESTGAAMETRRLRAAMGHLNERFAGRSQQDAHEFLAELLDQISEKIRELTSDKTSPLHNLPGLRYVTSQTEMVLTCPRCSYKRSRFEEVMIYSLDLPKVNGVLAPPVCPLHGQRIRRMSKFDVGREFWGCGVRCDRMPIQWVDSPAADSSPGEASSNLSVSVADLLAHFFSEKTLELRCDECQSTEVVCRPRFDILADNLILHLKRFEADSSRGTYVKRNDPVQINIHLDVSKFTAKGSSVRYRLQSIVSHIGQTSTSGHYIHDYRDPKTAQWTRYDDSSVKLATEHKTMSEALTQGYILFYTRIND